jgi:hypothetical protein
MPRTSILVLAGAAVLALASAVQADEIINLSKCDAITTATVHDFAKEALTKRKYSIASDTPSLLVGELEKHKVEIAIEPQRVVIRWQGPPKKNEYWLRNLKTDLLWALTE